MPRIGVGVQENGAWRFGDDVFDLGISAPCMTATISLRLSAFIDSRSSSTSSSYVSWMGDAGFAGIVAGVAYPTSDVPKIGEGPKAARICASVIVIVGLIGGRMSTG